LFALFVISAVYKFVEILACIVYNIWVTLARIYKKGEEKMKIKKEHYQFLKDKMKKIVDQYPSAKSVYKKQGLSDMRYRWDVLHATNNNQFVCDTLYQYLNDNHIDTALKNIIADL
jgi:hypothetical protein